MIRAAGTLTCGFALLADCASLRLCGSGSGAAIFGCSDGASGGCSKVRAGRLVVHQRRNRARIAGILWAGRESAAAIAASGRKIGAATIDLANQFVRARLCRRDSGCELSLPFCFLIFGMQVTACDADRRASRDHNRVCRDSAKNFMMLSRVADRTNPDLRADPVRLFVCGFVRAQGAWRTQSSAHAIALISVRWLVKGWLPFLDTYRTMCLAPQGSFRNLLEEMRAA